MQPIRTLPHRINENKKIDEFEVKTVSATTSGNWRTRRCGLFRRRTHTDERNSGLGSPKNGCVEANDSFVDEKNALIFGVDHDGVVHMWNETSAQVLGYTKEEATGKGLLEFLETDPRVRALLRCATKGTTENSARKVEL